MSTEAITFELKGKELGGTSEIKEHPTVQVFSRTARGTDEPRAMVKDLN